MHVYYNIEECVQQDPQCEGVDHYCTKSSVTFSSPLDPIDRLLYTPFTTSKHCKKLLLSRLVHLLTFTQMKQITSQVGGPAHSLTTPTPHSIVEIVYNEEKEASVCRGSKRVWHLSGLPWQQSRELLLNHSQWSTKSHEQGILYTQSLCQQQSLLYVDCSIW